MPVFARTELRLAPPARESKKQKKFDSRKRRLSDVVRKNVDGPSHQTLIIFPHFSLSFIMFYYVYLIQSIQDPKIRYVGYTTNLKERLATHNSGGSIYTKKDRPWKLIMCSAFKDIDCAKQFEKYLKSQSGRAFAKKRFW